MQVLGISGSIRLNSTNARLLQLAREILARDIPGLSWTSTDLTLLPYFDPELQYSNTPAPALELRKLAGEADLVLISTPEYAHGIPGILKNALEWMFCELTMKKPVAILIGAGQGDWVRRHLLDVLPTMDFSVDESQTVILRNLRSRLQDIVDPELDREIAHFLKNAVMPLHLTR